MTRSRAEAHGEDLRPVPARARARIRRRVRNPYKQNMTVEFARVLWMLALYSVSGAYTALGGMLRASVSAGHFVFDSDLMLTGALLGFCIAGIAMPPLWHRAIMSGWIRATAPGVAVGTFVGFFLGGLAGCFAGTAAIAGAAFFFGPRLPFVFPRHPPGFCPVCGYELRRLTTPRCPECGTDVLANKAVKLSHLSRKATSPEEGG